MKKYICSNCGYRSRFQVEKITLNKGAYGHKCNNCDAVAFSSKVVLESMMRSHMRDKKLTYLMD